MLLNKRQFVQSLTGLIGLSQSNMDSLLRKISSQTPVQVAQDEAFWGELRKGFTVTNDFIHLENGYYILASNEVLEAYIQHIRDINAISSRYMRTRQFDDKLAVRKQLAELVGASYEEVIITRNTTESLDTIISGIDWKAGDEVVMAMQDYGAMVDMFKQQARRYGIVNRIISIPNHPASDEEIVALYENAITPKTRLLMLCHIINVTGHILPVRKIADMAHAKGVEVMVDGAHAVGHFDFKLPDLHCDYYGSSLHKWLGCPLGAGMLYVKKDKIKQIWPLLGETGYPDDDIRKLNHTGTHPVHTDLALADAIKFHQKIGIARKEARLRYLQTYWTSQVRNHPGIVVNTPADPARHGAIGNVGVEKLKPAELAKILMERYKIWTVAIDYANVHGVRVTPHLFTTTQDLDALVKALKELA
ncbi:aminotransferase class V-fold PLP-dependent enzyme [Runella zeae]|uniref:aminotransferase class V-fold PLP-dependent enzyme n=1 Tax=Runella zeae TaxID=94255 RepID=UPI00041CB349|nr:aminotransferase class V-fold PLP-dependent enzyme [Runella zeae]